MSDDDATPAQQERNRRLFGGMIGWLLSKDRRPGMTGAAVSFSGRARSGPAQLKRTGSGWEFIAPGRRDEVTAADVLKLVGTGGFFPRTVDVVPDLAEMLFKEAVHQAEESLLKVDAAARHTQDVIGTDLKSNPIPWVLATVELDRSARASIASIVLAIAAAEAQVNRWADVLGGWAKGDDRLPVGKKCQMLARRVERPVNLGKSPNQQLHRAVKRRNAFRPHDARRGAGTGDRRTDGGARVFDICRGTRDLPRRPIELHRPSPTTQRPSSDLPRILPARTR